MTTIPQPVTDIPGLAELRRAVNGALKEVRELPFASVKHNENWVLTRAPQELSVLINLYQYAVEESRYYDSLGWQSKLPRVGDAVTLGMHRYKVAEVVPPQIIIDNGGSFRFVGGVTASFPGAVEHFNFSQWLDLVNQNRGVPRET